MCVYDIFFIFTIFTDSDNVIPRNLTPEVLQALRAVRFIAQHIKDADKDNEVGVKYECQSALASIFICCWFYFLEFSSLLRFLWLFFFIKFVFVVILSFFFLSSLASFSYFSFFFRCRTFNMPKSNRCVIKNGFRRFIFISSSVYWLLKGIFPQLPLTTSM